MIFKDYYRILEFKSNKVTVPQIKAAYRELAKKYHPDVNIGNSKAEERFKDITEAYRVLTDSASRKKYDRMWNSYIGNKKDRNNIEIEQEESVANDFFSIFFGNLKGKEEKKQEKKKIPVKGDNIETEININIREAFYGTEKKISLRTVEGKLKTFVIKVPAGIRDKEKIRLIGQGKEGKNGARNGDLFIKINIENDKKFQLKGYEIYTDLYLTPWEAALGTKVNIEGIDEEATIHIPAGIESGEKIKIQKRGYKDGKGSRGDLVAEVKIMIPKNLTQREVDLFKQLNEISNYNPRNKEMC